LFLCRNNQLYLVEAKHIVAVHAVPCTSEDLGVDPDISAAVVRSAFAEAVLLRWQLAARGQGTVAAGTSTATLAVALAAAQSKLQGELLLEGTGWLEAVAEAKERLQRRQADLAVVEAASRRSAGGQRRREAEVLIAQANGLRAQINSLRAVADTSRAAEAYAVENIVEVLKLFGAIEAEDGVEGRFKLTPVGLIGRDIRFDNELWLALILRDATLLVCNLLSFGAEFLCGIRSSACWIVCYRCADALPTTHMVHMETSNFLSIPSNWCVLLSGTEVWYRSVWGADTEWSAMHLSLVSGESDQCATCSE
jgi:hypothetical protein